MSATKADGAIRGLERIKADFEMRGANATTIERAIDCIRSIASKDTAIAEIRAEYLNASHDAMKLAAELARAKKALEPFAKIDRQIIQGHLSGHIDDENEVFVRVGDIRAAADVLSASRAIPQDGEERT